MASGYTPLSEDTCLRSRYFIKRLLGQGGMGAVYLANDTNLHTQVAIKENFSDQAELQEAFIREARILSKLRHNALPRCIEHFSESNRQFLVMEFVSGEDLETLLKRNRKPFEHTVVLKWAEQLLDALAHMHTSDPPIIHRDIKPLNIKLTPQGQIILLDFGLAKGASGHTTRGLFAFTADYAPLEQRRHERTDARSDLYSLAVSLYYLVTGIIPPNAEIRDMAVRFGQADPLRPAIEINPQIPLGFSNALTQAMSLYSDGRFLSATAFLNALRNTDVNSPPTDRNRFTTLRKIVKPITEPEDESTIIRTKLRAKVAHKIENNLAPSVRSPIRGDRVGKLPFLRWVKSFDLALNSKSIIVNLRKAKDLNESIIEVHDFSTGQSKVLLQLNQGVGSIEVSPDGKTVAFVAEEPRPQFIYICNIQTGSVYSMPLVEFSDEPIAFSPDGHYIAAANLSSLELYDVVSGHIRTVGKCPKIIKALTFSPNSQNLICGEGNVLSNWNLRSGKRDVLGDFKSEDIFSIVFSLDERFFATGSGDLWMSYKNPIPKHNGTVCLWNYHTKEKKILGRCEYPVFSLAFSPDNKSLISGGSPHGIFHWNLRTGQSRSINVYGRGMQDRVRLLPDGNTVLSTSSFDLNCSFIQAPSSNPKGNTNFRLKGYDDAKEVILAGGFNGWNERDYKLTRKNGEWRYQIDLYPGRYGYKFIVDGEWITDPGNPQTHQSGLHPNTINSEVTVK